MPVVNIDVQNISSSHIQDQKDSDFLKLDEIGFFKNRIETSRVFFENNPDSLLKIRIFKKAV